MNASATPVFALGERSGSVSELVTALPEVAERRAYLCRPTRAGVVVGSSQRLDSLDAHACDTGGFEVVRRRSGGGAVLVAPSAQIWLDIFVPAGDALYDRDVNRAAHVVGQIWRAALSRTWSADVAFEVHTGPNEVSEFSRVACFAGLGPGEVHLGRRKVVGLSQRRARAGAWFFSMALCTPLHLELTELLRLGAEERERLSSTLLNDVAVLEGDATVIEGALEAVLTGG